MNAVSPVRSIGVLVFPDVEELDFVGPWEMLRSWGRFADGPAQCLIVAEQRTPLRCANGLTIVPEVAFDDCPALDVLLVPGGPGTRVQVDNPALLRFVAERGAAARALLSVCTGAFVLHAAGLLQGHRATTHWGSLERLRALPGVEVVEERFVHDGTLWCSAGVSAGIDMVLAFIAEQAGDDAAGKVQFGAEYYPDRRRYGAYENHEEAPGYLRPGGPE